MSKKTLMVVRVDHELRDLLHKVCSIRGESVSAFIRIAVLKELASLSYLPAEEKKALGIKEAA